MNDDMRYEILMKIDGIEEDQVREFIEEDSAIIQTVEEYMIDLANSDWYEDKELADNIVKVKENIDRGVAPDECYLVNYMDNTYVIQFEY